MDEALRKALIHAVLPEFTVQSTERRVVVFPVKCFFGAKETMSGMKYDDVI